MDEILELSLRNRVSIGSVLGLVMLDGLVEMSSSSNNYSLFVFINSCKKMRNPEIWFGKTLRSCIIPLLWQVHAHTDNKRKETISVLCPVSIAEKYEQIYINNISSKRQILFYVQSALLRNMNRFTLTTFLRSQRLLFSDIDLYHL